MNASDQRHQHGKILSLCGELQGRGLGPTTAIELTKMLSEKQCNFIIS
jgi:hypothetical protein